MTAPHRALLDRLAATPDYTFPEAVLTEIRAAMPDLTPALLEELETLHRQSVTYLDAGSWLVPVFALFFLAESREKAAYPILIRLLRLSDEELDILFSDMITEDMGRILASVFDGNEEPLRNLIEDPEVPEFVRSACGLEAYACLLNNGILSLETVSAYFTELMRGRLKDDNQVVWSSLASLCGDLGLAHLIPDIKAAYQDGRCDPQFDYEDSVVENAAKGGNDRWRRSAELIGNPIELTRRWHCFEPRPPLPRAAKRSNINIPQFTPTPVSRTLTRQPKIGRNDPCPCASGKKFKKCCGA
jgi:hypothetical protein